MKEDFFSLYLSYIQGGETPVTFHRWSAIVGISALLGRNYSLPFGHTLIHPNMYCMLIGKSGTKKSTAIKVFKELMLLSGYSSFAAEKTTKEKFLIDLAGVEEGKESRGRVDGGNDFFKSFTLDSDSGGEDTVVECCIAADEFGDFFGNNVLEFVSLLGTLWDFNGPYRSKVKNSKSICVWNPTITLLSGNTPTTFHSTFPAEVLGQGFFSRLILVHSEASGKLVSFPRKPSASEKEKIVTFLSRIRTEITGVLILTPEVESLLDKIYKSWPGMEDVRFEAYANRRFIHLLKLCLVVSASRLSTTLTREDVIYANTILSHAEHFMPKALGEFGKARNSDVVHKIIQILGSTWVPLKTKDIWKLVSSDLEKPSDLAQILGGLQVAEKILSTTGGYLLKRKILDTETSREGKNKYVDYSLLTKEENDQATQ